MKRVIFGVSLGFALLLAASYVFAETPVTMPASPIPALLELMGTTGQTIEPALYPEFYDYKGDNPACGEYLKNPYVEGQETGFSLAPRWEKSKFETTKPAKEPSFVPLEGLTKSDLSSVLPANYRETSKLLFTWTVRIEAEPQRAVPIRSLCGGKWNGTSYQHFAAGQIKTQLYINDEPIGNPAMMTIPDFGNVAITELPPPPPPPPPRKHDPTLTGSCLVTKEEKSFAGGGFPKKMKVEIRWKNASCMKLKAVANMRNLIIAVVPITTQK